MKLNFSSIAYPKIFRSFLYGSTLSLAILGHLDATRPTYLFEIEDHENGGRKFHLFGTYHSLPLNELPEPIQEKVFSSSSLIVENKDITKIKTRDEFKELDFLKKENAPPILEKLTLQAKNECINVICPLLKLKAPTVKIEELSAKGLSATFLNGHFIKGMDYQLVKYYQDKGAEVRGLESLSDVSEFFPEPTLDELIFALEANYGFSSEEAEKDREAYLKCNYDFELDPEVESRNSQWFDKLDDSKKLGDGALVCVGVSHLLGSSGLINHFYQNHSRYKIRKYNSKGDISEFTERDLPWLGIKNT